jgi:hypothetical protein
MYLNIKITLASWWTDLSYLRSRALLQKLPVVLPLKNFPAFYGTRRFTVFTRALHCSISWARLVQSIPTHPVSLRSILVLSTYLRLDLSSGLFPSSHGLISVFNRIDIRTAQFTLFNQKFLHFCMWQAVKYSWKCMENLNSARNDNKHESVCEQGSHLSRGTRQHHAWTRSLLQQLVPTSCGVELDGKACCKVNGN